jgi:hypothetical protein
MQEFQPSVIEKIGYYVYLLSDPQTGEVFYVGKGIGSRIFSHLNAAIVGSEAGDKLDRIRSILTTGYDVQHRIIRHGLTEKEAFEVEAALIDFIGLEGLTNLVQGHNSDDRGQMTVAEVIAKYQAPEAHILEQVILITINKLYRRGMNAEDLYDVTRGNWVIGSRREKAKYAFAVYNGIIREVYEIEKWHLAAKKEGQKAKQRWYFDGKIALNLRHFVGGSTVKYAVVGAQNPIRYVNC